MRSPTDDAIDKSLYDQDRAEALNEWLHGLTEDLLDEPVSRLFEQMPNRLVEQLDELLFEFVQFKYERGDYSVGD